MTVLKVIEYPAKVLETRANEVTKFDQSLKNFVAQMHETMQASHGIGLAANQVGDLRRVVVINIPFVEPQKQIDGDTNGENHLQAEGPARTKRNHEIEQRQWWHDKAMTFINPQIIKKQGKIKFQEGCLSFPDIFDFVDRAAEVWVKAQDENGQWFEVQANDIFSVCLQHEIDHIDGIVFINRMSRLKAAMIRKKLQKNEAIQKIEEISHA